ncbi:MAG: PD-(D/E)XK nuclease family protein [Candidatus Aminicenantes bacterium]|nr:PD-(D/E)XK nuclease family protein [Candidatus Aminicenantes bacterium]
MTIRRIPPRADLIAEVAARLRPEGKDYSRSWVLFPEKRPAYYLRKALAERESTAFIPPRTDSLDGFVDAVYAERLGFRDRPLGVLDAVAVLFEVHKTAPGRLGGTRFLSPDGFFPLGVKLFHDLEELRMAAVRAEDLAGADHWTEETVPAETLGRLQSLSFFYEAFYARLEEAGFSTQASRYRAVVERLDRGLFPDVDRFLLAGFFVLTKTETELLKVLLSWDETELLLLEGAGLETVFASLGVPPPAEGAAAAGEPASRLSFTRSPDGHGQIFALNKALEETLGGRRPASERQVIVLPAAETLFPLHQQTLSRLSEDDYNISLGYPLSRTPVYAFFDALLELVQSVDEEGRVYIPSYLRFILHPYAKNIYGPGKGERSDLTRILVHAVEEELVRRRTKAFWSLAELESDPGIRAAVEARLRPLDGAPDVAELLDHYRSIHARTVAPLLAVRDVADFAAKLEGVLDDVALSGTAALHPFFHPYADALRAQLAAMAASLLGGVAFEDRTGYFNLFRKVAAAAQVPFYGTPLRGLQVLGFWETRCIRFDEVYGLDMNEDVLPPYRRGDSLLPFAARRALGLPTYQDNERRMEYYLDTLVRGARRAHFFFVQTNERERSRYVEKLIWEEERGGRAAAGEDPVRTVSYRIALQSAKPGPVGKTAEVAEFLAGFRYSATSLDSYLACPLKFYYAYVLRLAEKEEVGERMERRDVGSLVHSILEEYFGRFVGRPLHSAEVRAADLEAVVDRRFRDLYGPDPTGSAYLMGLQVRRHLAAFLTRYQVPLVRGLEERGASLRILGLEQRLETERAAGGRSFRLAAKIDRSELRGDGLTVLDYKTMSQASSLRIRFDRLDPGDRRTWADAVKSVQLPLYRLVCGAARNTPAADVRAVFLMLGKARIGAKIEFSPFAEGDRAADEEQLRMTTAIIDGLLTEIADPAAPFDPGLLRRGACEGCAYAPTCGQM